MKVWQLQPVNPNAPIWNTMHVSQEYRSRLSENQPLKICAESAQKARQIASKHFWLPLGLVPQVRPDEPTPFRELEPSAFENSELVRCEQIGQGECDKEGIIN